MSVEQNMNYVSFKFTTPHKDTIESRIKTKYYGDFQPVGGGIKGPTMYVNYLPHKRGNMQLR